MSEASRSNESCPPSEVEAPQTILLVHGTFAFDDEEEGQRWWQRNSAFCGELEEALRIGQPSIVAQCVPEGRRFPYVLPWWDKGLQWILSWFSSQPRASAPLESVFHWSGDNSQSARLSAAKMLLDYLNAFNERGPFHVIAHSHGGLVLWRALCEAAAKAKQTSGTGTTAQGHRSAVFLPNLRSWTTVATPYLHFGPDWWRLAFFFPFGALIVVLLWQFPWVRDYWSQIGPSRGETWVGDAGSFLALYGLTLLVICLIGRLFWSCYYQQMVVRKSPRLVQELRTRQVNDIISTIIGLAFVSVAAVPAMVVWGGQAWNVLTFKTFFSTSLACLWIIAAVALIFMYLRRFLQPVYRSIETCINYRKDLATWRAFARRSLILAVSTQDEAITALRAIRPGVRATILPRIPPPGDADLSSGKRHLLRPEREYDRQRFLSWQFRFLLLPIAIIRDWFIIPIYNDVFATLVDDYVIGQLHNKAYGNDRGGEAVIAVTDHPMGNRRPGKRNLHAVCSQEIADEIISRADHNAKSIVDAIRQQLGQEYTIGPEIASFYREAMQGKASAADALIHTSYFDATTVRAAIAARVAGYPQALPSATSIRVRPPRNPTTRTKSDVPRGAFMGFMAWIIRTGVKFFIFFMPVLLLAVAGWAMFYSWSRAFHLNWSLETDVALQVAADELNTNNTGRVYKTPAVVRWCVASRLLDKSLDDLTFGARIADIRKRVFFFAKLGEKYAQLAEIDGAVRSFQAARQEISRLPSRAEERGLVFLLGRSMLLSKRCMPPEEYILLKKRVGELTEGAHAEAEPMEKAVFGQEETMPWKKEYDQLSKWRNSPPPITDVLEWADAGEPRSLDLQVKRLAFVLCFYPGLDDARSEIESNFSEAVDKAIRAVETQRVADRKTQMNRWMRILTHILAVADVGDRTSSLELISQAQTLLALIIECPDERGEVLGNEIRGKILIARSLHASGHTKKALAIADHLHEQLQGRATSVDRDQMASQVASLYADLGHFVAARQLTDNRSAQVRLGAAIGIIKNELTRGRRVSSGSRPATFVLRLALWEDIAPD